MSRHRDTVTRAELDELFQDWGAAFTKAILQLLTPLESDAARAIECDERLRAADPEFHKAVVAVRAARQAGEFVTVGRDVGFREGAGVVKLGRESAEDAAQTGPAERAIKRRLRRER